MPVFALTATTSRRHELPSFLERELQCLGVDGIRLRDGDDTVLDPEQPQDGEVLMRLRACPLSCVDDEQEEVDSGGARDHRPHESLVAGDVDDR